MTDEYLLSAPSGSAATDTANLQTAISETLAKAQAFGLNGGIIQLRAGVYRFSPIEVRSAIRLRIRGVFGQTKWLYSGDAIGYALTVVNSQRCEFEDIAIDMGAGGAGGIHCLRDSGAGFAPSKNTFRNIDIDGRNATPTAVLIGGGGALDANNDFHRFEGCNFDGYTYAGIITDKSQSYGTQVEDCFLSGGGAALYGVVCAYGKVHWTGGAMNGHTVASIRAQGHGQALVFEYLDCEADGRLLQIDPSHSTKVTFRELRWANDKAHADGRLIVVNNSRASILMENCDVAYSVNPPPANTVDYSAAQASSEFYWRLGNFGSTAAQPFPPGAKIEGLTVYTSTDPLVHSQVNT